jgi:hypothetical protein
VTPLIKGAVQADARLNRNQRPAPRNLPNHIGYWETHAALFSSLYS